MSNTEKPDDRLEAKPSREILQRLQQISVANRQVSQRQIRDSRKR